MSQKTISLHTPIANHLSQTKNKKTQISLLANLSVNVKYLDTAFLCLKENFASQFQLFVDANSENYLSHFSSELSL